MVQLALQRGGTATTTRQCTHQVTTKKRSQLFRNVPVPNTLNLLCHIPPGPQVKIIKSRAHRERTHLRKGPARENTKNKKTKKQNARCQMARSGGVGFSDTVGRVMFLTQFKWGGVSCGPELT